MPLAMTERRNGAPPFTPKQAATIRKIARKRSIPRRDRDDFVKDVWLEVDRCWAKVPKTEPDTSRYINGIAHKMGLDAGNKRTKDPTANPVLFSSLPRQFSAPEGPSLTNRIGARELLALGAKRDPEAAEWTYRAVVEDEPHRSIAASAGKSPDAVRKRIGRLLEWMREKGNVMVGFVFLFFCVAEGLIDRIKPKPGTDLATSPSASTGPTSPRAFAEPLRQQAFSACGAALFTQCGDLLDQASAIDPAGENDPRVFQAREAIARAAQPPPAPTPVMPYGDKPPR